MSFTTLFAAFGLLGLIIIFVAAYKLKGWKTAVPATGAAFVLFAALLIAMIYAIVNSM
ncbi:MAG TPA: hypothetical protein VFR47_27720 [Anaerolineales bacterium]|nr:hypothetical protein [Anaerolineales bacterium]